MKIFICGVAGVLGSSLAKHFIDKGYEVSGNDKVRIEEAWRLEGYKDKIKYLWKSSIDLNYKDVINKYIIIDCALESADRPFGIDSPKQTLIGNLLPPLGILEAVRKIPEEYPKPICIYPSSFNVFYGHKSDVVITEDTPPLTSSMYGWTKMAAEQLYMAYHKAYEIPIIITRVGSAYGPTMRSDELVGRLMIYNLLGKDFNLRSPEAKRLWTFSEDVISFYDKLLEKKDECIGQIVHCAGNKEDEIITNWQLAERIRDITNSDININPAEYEPGEKVDGKPIDFKVDCSKTRELLDWKPKFDLDTGLIKTMYWFKKNLNRYSVS